MVCECVCVCVFCSALFCNEKSIENYVRIYTVYDRNEENDIIII